MTFKEVTAHWTDKTKTIGTHVGNKEIIVKFLSDKNHYVLIVNEPRKAQVPTGEFIGEYSTLEEVEIKIADLPCAKDIDPNGWVISPEMY